MLVNDDDAEKDKTQNLRAKSAHSEFIFLKTLYKIRPPPSRSPTPRHRPAEPVIPHSLFSHSLYHAQLLAYHRPYRVPSSLRIRTSRHCNTNVHMLISALILLCVCVSKIHTQSPSPRERPPLPLPGSPHRGHESAAQGAGRRQEEAPPRPRQSAGFRSCANVEPLSAKVTPG